MNKQIIIDNVVFETKPIVSRENIDNPEVAKFKARTRNRIKSDYSFKHEFLKLILTNHFPDIISHTKSTYYIPSKNLYIDDRLDKNHNYNLYREGNGIQQNLLNQLITNNEYRMIKTWCLDDLNKSKQAENDKLNYLEIYSYKDEEDVLTQIRRMSGLQIIYDKNKLRNELKNILHNNHLSFSSGCHTNKIIVTYQPHFYQQEQALYRKNITRRWVIENLQKYLVRIFESDISDGEILRQFRISRICDGFSQHSPYWIKSFINKYNVNCIYDPTGGWGHRLLGSWKIDYIYNDIDNRTALGTKQIYEDFKNDPIYGTKTYKAFYNEDSSTLVPKENYDCVFTCPPYFTTELYIDSKTSTTIYSEYSDWLNVWWKNTVKSSLKPSVKYFAFIINNTYKNDMMNICLLPEFNLEFIDEIKVNKATALNHFHRIPSDKPGSKVKNIQKGEEIIVFRKKLNV